MSTVQSVSIPCITTESSTIVSTPKKEEDAGRREPHEHTVQGMKHNSASPKLRGRREGGRGGVGSDLLSDFLCMERSL